jgi:type I restriction enzyme S subunit
MESRLPAVAWPKVPLASVATIQTGVAKGAKLNGTPVLMPYLRVANVQSGSLDLTEIKRIEVDRSDVARYSLRAGDVLMTEGGDFDKLGRGTIWNGEIEPCLHQNHVFAVRCDREQVLAEWLSWVSGSHYGRRYFTLCSKQSTNLASINSTQLKAFPFPLPSLRQQQKIAAIMKSAEGETTAISRLISAKRTFKRGLMQQLLTGQKRFPEFKERPWVKHRFDDLCEELSERNGSRLGADSVMGVIKGVGFEPMRDRVRGKGDLSRYKVVPPGAFAYNPMRLNIGSIAYNNLGRTILVSPDYEVFRARPAIADSEYVNQLRYSAYWSSFMDRAGSGSVRVRIYFTDLARLRVPAPDADEQSRIADVLRLAAQDIDQLEQLHELIEAQRRALLSSLLSGSLAVPP